MRRYIDLAGRVFGRLTVRSESSGRGPQGDLRWDCACECGRIATVSSRDLRSKTHPTRSCGCLQTESRRAKALALVGTRFGRLVVVRRGDKNARGNFMWACQCDCGDVVVVSGSNLRSGHTLSCGCLALEVRTLHGQTNTPEMRKVYKARRRALIRKAGGSFTADDLRRIYTEQRGACVYCSVRLALAAMEADHIMPLALGGSNHAENIQMLCRSCNRRKHDIHPAEFARRVGAA